MRRKMRAWAECLRGRTPGGPGVPKRTGGPGGLRAAKAPRVARAVARPRESAGSGEQVYPGGGPMRGAPPCNS